MDIGGYCQWKSIRGYYEYDIIEEKSVLEIYYILLWQLYG